MVLKHQDRYRFQGTFDEPAMKRLLEKAKTDGVITAFGTGEGSFVWFDGAGGRLADLRDLRQDVLALIDGGS